MFTRSSIKLFLVSVAQLLHSSCVYKALRLFSQVSSDSGRGASGIETPTATSPSELSDLTVYEFDFPTDYCGRLIGRAGKNINSLKSKTGAEIVLKRKPFVRDYQTCSIEGNGKKCIECITNVKIVSYAGHN